jgi:hypothetical protein
MDAVNGARKNGNKMIGTCIICRKNNIELTDEHIIPKAIGGNYHIYSVCKVCNSKLGELVDIKLSDHIIVKFWRERYNIPGKTGKIPSFFNQVVHPENDNDRKMKLYKDTNGEIKLKYINDVKKEINEDGTGKISISVDDSDKDDLAKIKETFIKRANKKGLKLEFSEPVCQAQKGMKITGGLTIDLLQFKIGLLKIVYESLCDLFPRYFDDPYAIEISKILFHANYEKVISYAIIGNGFQKEILDFATPFPIEKKNKHIIYFIYIDGFIYAFISIFDSIFLGIRMAKTDYLGKAIYIITNDFITKELKKFKFDSKNGLQDI